MVNAWCNPGQTFQLPVPSGLDGSDGALACGELAPAEGKAMNDETQADLRMGTQRRLRHDWEAEKKGMSLRVYCGSHGLHLNRLYAERLHSVANAGAAGYACRGADSCSKTNTDQRPEGSRVLDLSGKHLTPRLAPESSWAPLVPTWVILERAPCSSGSRGTHPFRTPTSSEGGLLNHRVSRVDWRETR